MSIFFASGNISDSQQSQNEQIIKNQKAKPTYNFDNDDGDYDKKRTVQTEKEKKWNAIKNLCVKITNQLNNEDFEKVWDNLQQLLKEVEKASKVIQKEGKYPSVFLKLLKKIDEDVTAFTNEQKKKLNKNAATAFNIMKQKLRNKIIPEFEADLKKIQELGEDYSSGDEEQEAYESEESEEESDLEDEDRGDWRSEDIMIRRKYFLKKQVRKQSGDQDESRKQSKDITEKDGQQVKQKKKQEKKKQPKFHLTEHHKKKPIEIKSVKQAEAKIRNLISSFHKLTTKDQREEYLDNLNEIAKQSKTYKDFERLSFLLVDIPIRVEVFRQMKLTHFQRDSWLTIYKNLEVIYQIFRESEEDDLLDNVQLFSENSVEKVTTGQQLTIYRAIQAFLITLESELRKSFIFIDKSDVEYSERLQDLINILNFMYKVSRDISIKDELAKQTFELSFKVLENMYFMSENFMEKINKGLTEELRFTELADQNTLQEYCEPILKSGIDQYVTKTILYLVFNHAVNQREKAKELLIMSNIPQTISECDYYTQAMYNRCIVQIGINAFHFGKYHQVQQFLSQICSQGKNRDQTRDLIKQFLAQGFARTIQERQTPRSKVLPYYLHLNVELIQSFELIASMILQIPYTLLEGSKISSKTFKKVYYEYERSHFIAQPLNHRDLIYAASCELKKGNWEDCYNRLVELQIWREMENVQTTHKNMLKIVKQYSLKCYIISHRKCFKSISLGNLAAKFKMEQKIIKKLVSKWIYSRQIQGSINEKGFLILAQKKHSPMQKLCENLYNKLEEIRVVQEQTMAQRLTVTQQADDQQGDHGLRSMRNFNLALNEKLKAILSKRT